mmetsp:Transcript_10775/g.23782  ORF Transcript_10775/g.23782 Transcript_10775/m.23782 type:complete len:260 (-) Transcript_10775:110-889(-)
MEGCVRAAFLRDPIHGDRAGPVPAQLFHLPKPLEPPVGVPVLQGDQAPPHTAGDSPGCDHVQPGTIAPDLQVPDGSPVEPGRTSGQATPRQVQRVQGQRHKSHHGKCDHGKAEEIEEHQAVQSPLPEDVPVRHAEHGEPAEKGVREAAHLFLPSGKKQWELGPDPAEAHNQQHHKHQVHHGRMHHHRGVGLIHLEGIRHRGILGPDVSAIQEVSNWVGLEDSLRCLHFHHKVGLLQQSQPILRATGRSHQPITKHEGLG